MNRVGAYGIEETSAFVDIWLSNTNRIKYQ